MQEQSVQHITIILNKGKPNETTVKLDARMANAFSLTPLQSENYSQPFDLPEEIANNQAPFDLVSRFAQCHRYSAGSPKLKLPISSSRYSEVVDPITCQLCERYTNLDHAAEAEQIVRLAKWLQFKELEQAVAAAVAVNYYTGFDDREVEQFMRKHQLDSLTHEQIEQVIEDNKDIFNYIEQKTKEQFIKQTENKKEE